MSAAEYGGRDPTSDGSRHVVRSHHDPQQRTIHIAHELGDPRGTAIYEVTLHDATADELDVMASDVGLSLVDRWDEWSGAPRLRQQHRPGQRVPGLTGRRRSRCAGWPACRSRCAAGRRVRE